MQFSKQQQKQTTKTDGEEESFANDASFNQLSDRKPRTAGTLSHDEEGGLDGSHSFEASQVDIGQLSKKKKQYIAQKIEDKTGVFSYAEDPTQYKKARKRL